MLRACRAPPPVRADLWDVPQRAAFERLLRRILSLPHKPALLLLNHYAYFASEGRFYDSTGAKQHEERQRVCAAKGTGWGGGRGGAPMTCSTCRCCTRRERLQRAGRVL